MVCGGSPAGTFSGIAPDGRGNGLEAGITAFVSSYDSGCDFVSDHGFFSGGETGERV